jgi:hypothetical protein
MPNLFRELRIAVRELLRSPGFVATAVLMLALGLGATTAIFSIVEGVLLRPLPFPHPGQQTHIVNPPCEIRLGIEDCRTSGLTAALRAESVREADGT